MLSLLEIKNFQSHRNTHLELHPNVNIIFGLSLSGKTAISRAINLVINNNPAGCKFYSNFAPDKGQTIVGLKLIEQKPIIITKTVARKSDKSKTLENTSYDFGGESFPKVGRDVPDEIYKVLNLTELNIQKQFDQPFLITSSPGEFARTINRITKLDKVDDWQKDISRRINKTKNEVSLLESQLREEEIEIAKYAGFEDLEIEIKGLKSFSDFLEVKQQNLSRIDSLLASFEDAEIIIENIKPALELTIQINKIDQIERDIIDITREYELIEQLQDLGDRINLLLPIKRKLKILEEKLEKIAYLEKKYQLTENILNLDGQIKLLTEVQQKLRTLESLFEKETLFKELDFSLSKIEALENSIEKNKKEYTDIKQQYFDALKGVKECPVFQLPCPATKEMILQTEKELSKEI
jgi:DNA repair ATPase RecN